MDVIALATYLAELALTGIILWYVIEWLPPMPDRIKRLCQLLLVLIFVLAAIGAIVNGVRSSSNANVTTPRLGPGTPNLGR
jgi:hypothetical protein